MNFKRPFSSSEWLATPQPVRLYVEKLEQTVVQLLAKVEQLEKRIDALENRLNQDSQNSNKPLSSDSPYKKPTKRVRKKKRKHGGQKGHKGHQQTLLCPTNF